MKLYYNPISTYSQKVLIAAREKNVKYEPVLVSLNDPAAKAEYKKINPHGKVPTLVLDDGWKIPESTIIVEYFEGHFAHLGGTRLIPEDKDLARRARFHDRMADLYINDPVVKIIIDPMAPPEDREPKRVAKAKETLDLSYGLLDEYLGKNKGPWMLGEHFTIADCSLAPCLFYCVTTHPFAQHKNIVAYWSRVAERPSVKASLDEAKPILAAMMGGKH